VVTQYLRLRWQGTDTYPALDDEGAWSHTDPVLNAILNGRYGPDPSASPTPDHQLAAAAERFEAEIVPAPPAPPSGPVRPDGEAIEG
jgi:hypothetical protein